MIISLSLSPSSYIQQLRDGVHNFFVTFIEVLRDRPPGHDWELEPGVTSGDYLFGFLQVSMFFTMRSSLLPPPQIKRTLQIFGQTQLLGVVLWR